MRNFILILFIFFCFFQAAGRSEDSRKLHDVVIIGGGLAGLSSAYELKGYDSVVLEKNDYLGGRVLTHEKNGISYDMGAVFRYPAGATLPAGNHLPRYFMDEGDGLAVNYKGKNSFCTNVMDCVSELGLGSPELKKISDFKNAPCSDHLLENYQFSNGSYKVLDALIKTIHAGEISDYTCLRQKDAFTTWPIEYYPEGNRAVVDSFHSAMSSKVELGAEVTSVEDKGSYVLTTYRQGGLIKKILSKSAIVSVPAVIAKRILKQVNPEAKSFLDAVKYGRFTVAVIALKDMDLGKFSYLLTPDFMSTVIIAKHLPFRNVTILLVYYADKTSREQDNDPDAVIINRSIGIIHQIKIGTFTGNNILFTDVKRWEYGGTIISDSMFKSTSHQDYSHPSKRVFLAGDYTYTDNFFPYGMVPAVLSGKKAARQAIDLLKEARITE